MLEAPKWAIDEANKIFHKFLWNLKPDKLKRSTMSKPIGEGGLKMIDVDAMAKALKAKWINKLYSDTGGKWVNIPMLFFNELTFQDFCKSNFSEHSLPQGLPRFYYQSMFILSELKAAEPLTPAEVKNESLWHNRFISVDRKALFYNDWYRNGIRVIGDLLDENNDFLPPDTLACKFGLETQSFLRYYSLRHAIPSGWKQLLRSNKSNVCIDPEVVYIDINGVLTPIGQCLNKDLYWQIVRNRNQEASNSFKLWQTLLNIESEDLPKFFYLPFTYIRECKIQSMQFKILNNIYPSRLRKRQWKVLASDVCFYCEEIDSIFHHFCDCAKMKLFWNSLKNWWFTICKDCSINTKTDILLGITDPVCHRTQLNFIILMAKWHIYRAKHLEQDCSFLEFLPELKSRLKIEELIYIKQLKYNKFVEIWYEMFILL